MSIANQLQDYADGLGDAYDAVNDMQGIIPQDKNMDNLDTAIRTIPQNQGPTYTAGNGITISAQDEISIDDTVVAELSDLPGTMTGATSGAAGASGLVPAPAAGDQDKYLKGDGTWGVVSSGATTPIYLYYDGDVIPARLYLYKDSAHTTPATGQDLLDNITAGNNTVCIDHSGGGLSYLTISISTDWSDGDSRCFYISGFGADGLETDGSGYLETRDDFIGVLSQNYLTIDKGYTLQQKLTAGSNITISNNTISATDTTYSAFTGATSSVAGSAGLVPAPTTSDPDKFLKGDGTWATVSGGGINHLFYWPHNINLAPNVSLSIYKDASCTQTATYKEITDALRDGGFSLMRCYVSSGDIEEGVIWQSVGGYYTEDCDEGINEIGMVRSDFYGLYKMSLTPDGDCGNENTAATYNVDAISFVEDTGEELTIKSNDNGTYSFISYSKYNYTATTQSLSRLLHRVDSSDYSAENLTRRFTRNSTQSTIFPNVYQYGYFLTKVNQQSPAVKELFAIATKIVNGATQTVMLKVTATNGTDTDIILTEIPFDQVMTGATSGAAGTSGLVPQPAAGDNTKFLAGDGTWKTAGGGSAPVFYTNKRFLPGPTTSNCVFYKDQSLTTTATFQDMYDAAKTTGLTIACNDNSGNLDYYQVIFAGYEYSDSVYFIQMISGGGDIFQFDSYLMSTTTFTVSLKQLQDKLTAGSNITITGTTISATDTTYSNMTGATASVAGAAGLVPAPAAGDQEKVLHGDGTWKDTTAKLVEMSYGEANAWTKFINAYNAGSIVYCRASSNANPGTGSQTRKAFMAYVNDASSPTSVEFQYVRSVSSKTSSQPVDQVFVYTLKNTNGGTWSVVTRDMGPKIAAGTGISVSYSNGTYTISLA